ncbi:MAG: dipeptidase, partial [Bacteroidales bacterium]|nr:dipeptidase [Bacteroidales bacterium]
YSDMIVDVQKVQSALENGFQAKVAEMDAKYAGETDAAKLAQVATEFSFAAADEMFKTWKNLDEYLLVKYIDGNIKKVDENGRFKTTEYGPDRVEFPDQPAYPDWYYKKIVEDCGENIKVVK